MWEYCGIFFSKILKNLQKLVFKTNSKLVISSTWRKDVEGKTILLKKLHEYGLDNFVIGYTPILNCSRGNEIKSFINALNVNINFIIIFQELQFPLLCQVHLNG